MKQASKVPLWRKLVTYFTVACLLMHNLVEAMEADEDHDSCNWVTGKNPYGISNPISWAVCGNESEGENREEERLDEEEFEEVDYESNNIEDVLLEYNTVLSNEMITRILNFLDKETLKSMRLVSKRYHDLVDDFVYKPALNYKPLEPATEDYKKLVQNYYLTLPINSYLIIETFKGNVPLYKQKDGKIDLKAIWPNETLPCSSNELFSKITKFLKIKASKIRRMLPCTFYRSTDKRQTVNLTKEELATNVLYERTCQGDLEAYEALKGKAAEDPLATGLLLRYLALNGKYLLNSLAVYNTAQGYLNKYKDKLLDLASQGHPYALDISATMLSLPETAMTHASQAVEQNLSRANEHLATLASNKANFHLLRAFKNGSLYAALKLAANVSIDDEPLSLEILKYAAIQGDRDALAEIGRYYERNNQPTIAFLYYRILVLEDHVLGFYKLGMQWFKEWTGRRNDYRLSLLAEKALYISLDHYQKLSSLSLSKWTHKKDLQDNLHKGYKRLICLWMRQVSSKHYYRPPVLNSEIKLERLRVKLESFVWHPNKRKQEGVELLLKVAKKITRYKLDKSSTNKLEYSQILSSIWLCLWRLLKEELCNIRLLPASDEFSLPYPKSVVEALEASLEPHYKYLKREEIIFNKDLNAFQRTHFLNHYLFISLISSRMDKNAIERSYPNYLTSFYNLAKIFHKRKKKILWQLKSVILSSWDILLFSPHINESRQEVEAFLHKNSEAYKFIISVLQQEYALQLVNNLSIAKLSHRLRNLMLYTLSNSGRGSENAVYIIESVLKFLKEKAALELAAEFNKQDNRNTNVLKDVLLCAYYATQCQNKKAYEHALNALRLGRFDNILTLLKASWINIEFREEFFRKAQPELEEMVKHYRITLIDPDILSFLSACFFSGTEFLPKSLIKGYEWYRYALQYGAQKAHHTLINILQINNRLTNIAGINVIDFYKHLIDMNYPACHIAQLHLARLYLEKVDGGKENYKLSFNYLTSSLAHEKIGTKRRQNYQWKNAIGQEVRYSFEHMERFLLVQLQDKRKPLYKRGQAAYNLACLHMWGGYQKEESIYKTLYYFGLALNMGITHSDFFLTVIRYHLTELLGHKEFRSPNPIRGWYRNALEKLITSHSEEIRATLKIPSPSQLTKRALKEMDPIFNTYCKEGLAYTGLLPALCYKYGIGGTTIDITRSIEWLRKTAPHDKFADFIFKKMYPAFQILQEKELIELNERRFDADSKLRICFIGGGITAIISALLVARLEGKNNNPLFDVHIFEKEPQLLDGASKLISRLHLGGEYPKDEKTARQCLLSAILIRQLFQTELFLTERKFIDFLLAEASPGTPREENHLTFDDLLEQYKNLQQDYQVYYQILEQEWHNQTGSKLFGLPEHFVNKLSPEQIEALGIGTCYNAGLHTPERGFQPVGMGILLEYLLGQYKNITIHRSSEISHIERIGEQGFRLEVSPQTSVPYTFYTQYLVNSAWASVPYINSLVKIGSEGDKMDKPKTTTIYLRSMALIDISRCELPEDRSFFGLIGEHGGMLSCFNSRVASLFIPGEDLSYQGEYTLNEDSPLTNNLPDEAREAFNMLSYDQKKKKKVAKAILANAVKKYPPLKEATVIDLITRTTLTRDAEIHQRQHDNVRWVDSELRCLEAYSPKGSFAIFTALQVIARLSEHRDIACHMKSLNKESRKFLKTINKGIDFEDKSFIRKIAKLPADFILVKEDTNLPSPLELVQLARKYEFYRNLPFTLFEEHTKGFKANMGIAEKFKAIEWGESIDLQHIDLTADLVETLIDQFKNGNIKHLKLGKITIDEQESDEGDESGEYNTRRKSTSNLITLTKNLLKKVSSITSLQSLSLNQWDLNHKNYIPSLRKLLAGLKSFTLSNGSLSEELVGGILSKDFKNSNLQSLTFSQLTDSSNAIHTVIGHIDLFPNIQEFSVFPDSLSLKDLEIMIKKQRSLKRLSLRGDLMSAESASASGKEIDKQLKGALNLLLAIANAKHLEYVDIRGNKKLHLCQKGLDYYFDITSAIESPLAAPPSSDYLQRITKAEKGKEKKE